MESVVQTIQDHISVVTQRAEQLRSELASVEAEKADLQTTLRILSKVAGEDVSGTTVAPDGRQSRPASEKKKLMFEILNVGREAGLQPADVYKELVSRGIRDISIQVVRTTLWRAAKNGELQSAEGQYWKLEAEASLYDEASTSHSSAGLTAGGAKPDDRSRDHQASHNASLSRSGEVEHEVG